MSTRSNILLIKQEQTIIQYYHHYDGYLKGVGRELVEFAYKAFNDRLNSKYNEDEEKQKTLYLLFNEYFNKSNKTDRSEHPPYEYEGEFSGASDSHLHGDIDYLYLVDFSNIDSVDIYCLSVSFEDFDLRTTVGGDVRKCRRNGLNIATFSYSAKL